jgi:hypothetical protein
MLQWWLNLRWASETHADALAKLDLAMVLCGATLLVAFAVAFALRG